MQAWTAERKEALLPGKSREVPTRSSSRGCITGRSQACLGGGARPAAFHLGTRPGLQHSTKRSGSSLLLAI